MAERLASPASHYKDRLETPRFQLGVDWAAKKLIEQVFQRLTWRYPKADRDGLLSDAGLGVALALSQSDGQSDTQLFETAYRRSIDAHRDQYPPANRVRQNPDPQHRDSQLEVMPTDPHQMPDVPVPPEPAEAQILDLLDLIEDPIQRDVVTRHGLEGRSYYELQDVYDVSVQRVHNIYWSGIANIRVALGLPVTRRMARARQWVRKDKKTLYDPRGISFADDSENGKSPGQWGATKGEPRRCRT